MIIPRIKFDGDSYAQMMNCIFAETLEDLLCKFEDGTGEFPRGFLHTSTISHEGTCYYDQMWTRDCGRGVIEMAALGFKEETLAIARYFLSHITVGSHWTRELNNPKSEEKELDGDALILLSLYNVWLANECDEEIGKEFLNGIIPVIDWISEEIEKSPYGGLLPSESELSGNPNTPTYVVYPIYGNYAMLIVLSALSEMAFKCSMKGVGEKLNSMSTSLWKAIKERLVSDGVFSYSPDGCWINAIDGRDGRAYDIAEWDGTSWPAHHWTRQLPFIFHSDFENFTLGDIFESVNNKSYDHVYKWMCTGKFFRKYGFVSTTGWTGIGGRHDDTMCGYGQGFFTQAALLEDDINTYSKCLEGIARLGYDGSVVQPLSFEMNPWVMHECFNYENYEEGLDHTFGVLSNGRREVMNNPGDEGNLVQEAEIIKAIRIVVGVRTQGEKLVIMPRLPWMWSSVEVKDFPVRCADNSIQRISFSYKHERWLRKCSINFEIPQSFENVDVRFGPFPSFILRSENKGMEIEKCRNGSWIWVRGLMPGNNEYEILL